MIVEGDLPARTMDQPKISIKESSQKEKQIVESSIKHGFFETAALAAIDLHSPSPQPPKPKFLSLSLPNSASSSPLFTSTLMRKKSKGGGSIESPSHASNLMLKHQDLLQKIHLRSKSFAEGRAFALSDEFDVWLAKSSVVERNIYHDSFSKTEEAIKESHVNCNDIETLEDEGFKCSALCLYLPGFAKAKPVKARKEGLEVEAVISRTVSLEKFECGSWSSSVLFHEIEGGDPMNSFFDLPMELIKCSANDVHAPVTSAFVFEKDLKGVLKNGSSRACARKSDTSPHRVRFSTSSSTSHPSLRKTREDFNAFLEAQSA
ncbi:uncharacterized protein LOC133293244 [Gastrolobium bilobum]|uniref:uncharacterized protein LOC133293244 n=1 Tax=Gastrolobium bilobum TaxID=150636 RepID=UPI002AB026D3|nr:uncharacterized protein LOC133293244 [Gastrolobium bilobum]